MMIFNEVNFDGLVAPNHNYAGLAPGNLASLKNCQNTAYPKKAALQGLKKMRLLNKLGLVQAIIPPQERPALRALTNFGFQGHDQQLVHKAGKEAPHLLAAVYSAASMWTANCATVSPSQDTKDTRVHFTPANLATNFHRSLEGQSSFKLLNRIFSDRKYFAVHPPLPLCEEFADEGAANHMRFCPGHASQGLHLFVFGKGKGYSLPSKFNPRQNINASEAVIRMHGLKAANTILARQSLQAINKGVFHNDVISTGNEDFFILHQHSFENQHEVKQQLQEKFSRQHSRELLITEITEKELKLDEAVSSYLFNTQIVTLPDQSMLMIAPLECQETTKAAAVIDKLISGPSRLKKVAYVNLRESMQNGGGPACLRLRVVLSEEELQKMHQGIIWTKKLDDKLVAWVNKHYREELAPADLLDFKLVEEVRTALDELTQILALDCLYSFQK